MHSTEIEVILDTFAEDPEATIAMISEEQTKSLLSAILSDVPKDTNWMHLIRMANGLGGAQSVEWFRQILRAANNELRRRELLQALVDYGTDEEEDLKLLRFEDAIANGVFDELIVHMGIGTVERFATGSLARPVLTAYSAGRIQRFIESCDPKRAFDELVISATTIEGWLPPLFEKWVERTWQAHRNKGLVTDLSNDARDWRNNASHKTIRFGQNRTGFITKKPRKPTINVMEEPVPLGKLWERYCRPPNENEMALDWGTRSVGYGTFRNRAPTMVNKPGNMLRDMAWYWHNEAKERKLRTFCAENGIDCPPPA